jgi:hypothetical protein
MGSDYVLTPVIVEGHSLEDDGYARQMSDEERRPIEEVLPGQAIHPLPEGWTPMEAFVLIKCMDGGGDSAWNFRTTNPLNLEEWLGALTVQVETIKRKLVSDWEDEDGDAPF